MHRITDEDLQDYTKHTSNQAPRWETRIAMVRELIAARKVIEAWRNDHDYEASQALEAYDKVANEQKR